MLAEKVIKQDREIDRRENEINEQTIVMMAKQQPVATIYVVSLFH